MTDPVTFSFGHNWQKFAQNLDSTQIEDAIVALQDLVGESLQGASFLDVGCGSGLSSLAAYQLGVSRIVSFDSDPYSVATSRSVKAKFAAEADWEILEGSILDPSFVALLEKMDIVYSWGVLHHTGQMWKAIETTAQLVKPNGLLVLAIYNQTSTSEIWLRVKKFYNRRNTLIRQLMVWGLFVLRAFIRVLRFKHPFRVVRGMSLYYDAADWLGGLPYEYAVPAQIRGFVKGLGFDVVRENLTSQIGCNEFVFVRRGA